MKRTLYFVMALALVLGLAQCKKEQTVEPENETKTVNITLKVGGNGGSRHDINTTTGAVDFQDGDVIYVGNGSTYIGTLTKSGENFSGDINEPTDGTEIYFFFVGGLPTTPADLSGKSSFTVDISNQSTQMPVLSCNHVTYYSSTTSYSCTLQNQCALVQFTTASTTDPVHVGGLYTEAKIDFANNSITNNGTTGFVALNSKSATEKWAVLLPQTGFGAEAAVAHVGYTTTIPTIAADAFITGEDAVSISTQSNIVYLDWLTSNYTATDGQTLKGTLGANVKISIAADATVTLNNATITGTNSDSYLWAGINCENNATIILEGTNNVTGFYENYPGIFIASGKTLTIEGNGSLDVSSNGGANGWGAGIGSNDVADCGNIVINSGTISATGGIWMAGIGCGYAQNCGYITINGGTVTATGGIGAAGIGTGYGDSPLISCGNISITGGIVNATGGLGAAGIGSGFVVNNKHNQCGDISITGGQVTATGGDGGNGAYPDILDGSAWANIPYYGGAGIGTGSTVISDAAGYSDCGTITIGSGVTRVTATKGGGTRPATNSIGKNHSSNPGICGTVTIGGTEYPSGATPNQGDGLTFVYPVPAPPTAPAGAINGLFSVSATQQVWFSQGNLLNTGNFADNQYAYGGLLQWAASYTTNYSGDWRALTSEEWNYLLTARTNASNLWGFANVEYSNGIILLPDGSSLSIDTDHSAWENNSIDNTTWSEMEANGAVFLPAAGYLDGSSPEDTGKKGYYWCSTSGGYMSFGKSGSSFEVPTCYVGGGGCRSVRLVINVQ